MAMTDLIPWRRNRSMPAPWRSEDASPFLALRREMDRMFDDFFRGFDFPMSWRAGWPHVDVNETADDFKISAELPGMDPKDIEVSLYDGALRLRGEKKSESGSALYSERWHGQFERSVQLGPDIDPDKVNAAFKNGVLTITVPKRPEAQRQVKRIAINS